VTSHLSLARELLGRSGFPADRLQFTAGPGWMFDPRATAPFLVHTVTDDDLPVTYVAIDQEKGTAHHRDPAAVKALFLVRGYPADPARLTPTQVLTAWLVLGEGVEPALISSGGDARDPAIRPYIGPPRTHLDGDVHITVGWTSARMGRVLVRHTLRVDPDGTPHIASEPAADVLYRPRVGPR
jgi:hypothetical protein